MSEITVDHDQLLELADDTETMAPPTWPPSSASWPANGWKTSPIAAAASTADRP